jgi:hypothetical protein
MADLYFNEIVEAGLLNDFYEESNFNFPQSISDFEDSFSTAPILRLYNGYPFVKGLTPEEELAAFEVGFRELQNKSYADSIGAITWRNDELPALSLNKIVNQAESKKDSLSYAQHYYELFHWLPFNQELIIKGVEFTSSNRDLDTYSLNMIVKGMNNGLNDPFLIEVLDEIRSREN